MSLASWVAMALALATLVVAWVRRVPIVMGITIANFLVFGVALLAGRSFDLGNSPLLTELSTRVAYLVQGDWTRLHTLLTSTFLHAGVAHIIGNMIVLLLLGLPFEERVGRGRFLLVYFFGAFVAVLLHAFWIYFTAPNQIYVPLVGASGAVFGILGAFAVMYPRDQVPLFLLFIVLPRVPVYIAAVAMTAIEGLFLLGGATSGVARAAHIGGAFGGVLLGLLLRPPPAGRAAQATGRRLDYAALDRLATEPHQQALVKKLRDNEDHPDTQRAWLDRLVASLQCPQCGAAYGSGPRGLLVCRNGHRERYVE